MKYPEYEKAFSPARLNKYLTALLGIIDIYLFSMISSNSAGVTTIGVFGKCFDNKAETNTFVSTTTYTIISPPAPALSPH